MADKFADPTRVRSAFENVWKRLDRLEKAVKQLPTGGAKPDAKTKERLKSVEGAIAKLKAVTSLPAPDPETKKRFKKLECDVAKLQAGKQAPAPATKKRLKKLEGEVLTLKKKLGKRAKKIARLRTTVAGLDARVEELRTQPDASLHSWATTFRNGAADYSASPQRTHAAQ